MLGVVMLCRDLKRPCDLAQPEADDWMLDTDGLDPDEGHNCD